MSNHSHMDINETNIMLVTIYTGQMVP